MASEIDRQEVRWQRLQSSGTATNRDGDFGSRCPYGRGKPAVGLSADSRCIIESRAHSGPHHNCQHPEAPWHRPSTELAVDGSDFTLSNGCRGWVLRWKTIFGHR